VEKKFMNIKELAQYIGYNITTIRNLVRQEKIPYYKPAGKLLFMIPEIDQWVLTCNGRRAEDD